ncbi:hypothetical protein DM558_00535 [Entomomonas moraniae]|uniref:Tail fiber protein n=1 Tax=Entomomonas moraniae TaxID=2213226 RepID=A0A3S9XA99_9GAMM|nr:hypothetical protein [Entomomonas moraniae]AZS49355.1 hypothetical protein DM558_00535 [Entomomonas moraniae]
MTVTTNLNFKEYQANGIATTFTIPFLLLNENDLNITIDSVTVSKNVYKINGIGNPQSEIIFYSAPKGKLVLQRSITLLRDTDYQENGDLLAATLNQDFDRIYLILQGFRQNDNQTLKVSDPEGINTLPLAALRANKILGFGSDGQPLLTAIASGSALELAQSLADTSDLTKGAGIVGYNNELPYPEATIGSGLNNANKSITALNTQNKTLTEKVTKLEQESGKETFTILYPNGGTKETPANIATNKRYIEDNPYPASKVICELEIYYGGVWGTTGWINSGGGWGAVAGHNIETNKIIIQTGSSGIAGPSNAHGNTLGTTSTGITTAPCRVKIWRTA